MRLARQRPGAREAFIVDYSALFVVIDRTLHATFGHFWGGFGLFLQWQGWIVG